MTRKKEKNKEKNKEQIVLKVYNGPQKLDH